MPFVYFSNSVTDQLVTVQMDVFKSHYICMNHVACLQSHNLYLIAKSA